MMAKWLGKRDFNRSVVTHKSYSELRNPETCFQDLCRPLKNQTMTSIFYPNDCALRILVRQGLVALPNK